MASRRGPVTPFLFFVSFLAGLIVAYSLVVRRNERKYQAIAEYWVFLPGEVMPTQESVMTRLVGSNPYTVRGQNPISPAEGLVFSDVRLHIALVLRKKNPHTFRPDLFGDGLEVGPAEIKALDASNSFVKLRFASDIPLKDRRHLQFLIHAADAYAALGDGLLVYDLTQARLISTDELAQTLRENFDATVPALHTRVVWMLDGETATAETRGLQKVGHPDLIVPDVRADQRILIEFILEGAIEKIWNEPILPRSLEIPAFDDLFRILIEPSKDHKATARILRIQQT